MVRYAREDTHYLPYISDRLHNELIKSGNANSNLLQSVYARSKDVCLKVCGLISLLVHESERHGHLMVNVFVSRLSGPGFEPWPGTYIVLLVKTLYSHSASLHPGV